MLRSRDLLYYEPPAGSFTFAEKRSRAIRLEWSRNGNYTLNHLCACIYLQAVSDIAEALEASGPAKELVSEVCDTKVFDNDGHSL